MKRLIAALGFVLVHALASAQGMADANINPTKSTETSGVRQRLIDVHSHLVRGLSLDQLIKIMDENAIAMTVLMPTPVAQAD